MLHKREGRRGRSGHKTAPTFRVKYPGKMMRGTLGESWPTPAALCTSVHLSLVTLYVTSPTGNGPSADRRDVLKCILTSMFTRCVTGRDRHLRPEERFDVSAPVSRRGICRCRRIQLSMMMRCRSDVWRSMWILEQIVGPLTVYSRPMSRIVRMGLQSVHICANTLLSDTGN
jgi:hypothetical protein